MDRSKRKESMTRLSTSCMDGRHDRCVDGAALYCQCPCHTERKKPSGRRARGTPEAEGAHGLLSRPGSTERSLGAPTSRPPEGRGP